ncbi:bifunctional non-homologous end joining protein LigD [Micromonospora pattaloongensis]|uniref:DNA ligase (ATP) n=1 Tax=Micromonospora pattaloongensis TaxID=405436 RepID=A0A1H3QSB8_9ACTN|nr:bifunctional non-homologous end joining protein LigD [Micromonospora pattaloongensis]
MPVVQPMLATAGALPSGAGWGFEFKWDGVRAIVAVADGTVQVISRNGRAVNASYPELVAWAGRLAGPLLLDGEIVALDEAGRPSFSLLQRRMHVTAPGRTLLRAVPVRLYLFDVLQLGAETTMAQPYQRRRAVLEELELPAGPVDVPPHWTGEQASTDLLAAAGELGLEGVVAKRLDSPYQPGRRSASWIKVPLNTTVEVVIGGYKPGGGRRTGLIGSLLLGMYDPDGGLRYVGHVGTGFTHAALVELRRQLRVRPDAPFAEAVPREHARDAVWVEPDRVGEVTFRTWTPERRLRHASWRGLRPDREPAEVLLD